MSFGAPGCSFTKEDLGEEVCAVSLKWLSYLTGT